MSRYLKDVAIEYKNGAATLPTSPLRKEYREVGKRKTRKKQRQEAKKL